MNDNLQHRRASTWAARFAVLIMTGGALLAANPARANPLDLTYAAYRLNGQSSMALRQGEFIRSGEKLLIKIKYINQADRVAPAGAIILTLPVGCAYLRSDDANHLEVSVDGGRQFGALSHLQVGQGSGARAATGDDVTHIRMTFDHPIAPGEGGAINVIATQE